MNLRQLFETIAATDNGKVRIEIGGGKETDWKELDRMDIGGEENDNDFWSTIVLFKHAYRDKLARIEMG